MADDPIQHDGASRDDVAKQCENEMARLVEFFSEDDELQIVLRNGKESTTTGNMSQRKKVAAHLEDSKSPFSVLVNEIVKKLGNEGDHITLASVRTLVLEIGLRVCFGISNTDADPLEDNTAASLRRWEVRELKLLPAGYREEISERRRRRRKIMARLACLNSVVELLRGQKQSEDSDCDVVLKAREMLAKTENESALRVAKLDWLLKKKSCGVPAQQPEVTLNGSVPELTNVNEESSKKRRRSDPDEREKQRLEKLLKRQRFEEEKEQKRREKEEAEKEKEAEKELKRKEKEEAEKKRQEKEAEREQRRREKEEIERKRQEKEAEKEQKRKEKEEAERKKQMALKKQASFMDRFLQTSRKEPKEQGSQGSNDSKDSSLANEGEGKAESFPVRGSEPNDVVATMDMIFRENEEFNLDDLKRQHICSWREIRRQMTSVKPPGWGDRRKPKTSIVREIRLHGATTSPDVTLKNTSAADSPVRKHRTEPEADCLEDVDWEGSYTESLPSTPPSEVKKLTSDRYLQLRSKTKKLLQFDKSHRPPYYGTFSKKSHVIKPRNPLRQDPALAYAVDSDEEWEEDEPGECLSDFENEKDEEDERVENEEDDESSDEFMVPDGYLSEGEGVLIEVGTRDTGGPGDSDHIPTAGQSGCDTAPNGMSREHLRKILDKATEHALRTNRPLIINNLVWDSGEDTPAINPPSRTETLILEALRIRVVTPTTIGVA